jgi:uncharacterized membrane protein
MGSQAAPYVPPAQVNVAVGRWIDQGWQLVKQDLGLWVVMAILFSLIGGAVPVVLQGPLMAGFAIAAMKKMLTGRVEIGDLFKGFDFFVPSLVACLLYSIFAGLGVVLCILPVFWVVTVYQFMYLFIVDKRMDFWPAMEASRAVIAKDFWGFLMFWLACALLNLLGVLACIVGVFVTIPITMVATVAAYRDVVGFEQRAL